jgi:DNA polymerase elongation subunit (family B)
VFKTWIVYSIVLTLGSANGNFDLFDDLRDDERNANTSISDASDYIVDIREYDVPYHVRVLIDLGQSPYFFSTVMAGF